MIPRLQSECQRCDAPCGAVDQDLRSVWRRIDGDSARRAHAPVVRAAGDDERGDNRKGKASDEDRGGRSGPPARRHHDCPRAWRPLGGLGIRPVRVRVGRPFVEHSIRRRVFVVHRFGRKWRRRPGLTGIVAPRRGLRRRPRGRLFRSFFHARRGPLELNRRRFNSGRVRRVFGKQRLNLFNCFARFAK